MILLGSGSRLQTLGGLAAQLFDSTLRTVVFGLEKRKDGGRRNETVPDEDVAGLDIARMYSHTNSPTPDATILLLLLF